MLCYVMLFLDSTMSCDVTEQRIKRERLGTRLRATLMFNSPTKMIVVVGNAIFPNTESLNLMFFWKDLNSSSTRL